MPRRLLIASLAALGAIVAMVAWSDHERQTSRQQRLWQAEQREAELLAALDRPVHLARQTVTLPELAALLSCESGVAIELDQPAVEKHLWQRMDEAPVKLSRATLPLRTALDLALEQRDLTWSFRGGRVVITTKVAAEDAPLRVAVYPLPQPALTDAHFREEVWGNDLHRLLYVHDWVAYGGTGHIEHAPGGLLIVHRPIVQRDLRRLHVALAELDSRPPTIAPILLPAAADVPTTHQLLEALRQPCAIDCRQMPLEDLIEYLAIEHNVPLALDYAGLQKEGMRFNEPVTQRASGSLRSVLRHITDELDLTFAVYGDAIIVTAPSQAEVRMLLAAYPVHDLLRYDDRWTTAGRMAKKEPYLRGYDALIDLITTVVTPDSWEDVGGTATIIGSSGGWLVVSHSLEGHEQIETLLADLRQALLGEAPPRPVFAGPHAREAETRVLAALDTELPFDYDGWKLADLCDDLGGNLNIAVRLEQRQLEASGINVTVPVICRWPAAPLREHLGRLCDALYMDYAIHNEGLVLTTEERAEDVFGPRVHDVRLLIDPDLGAVESPDDLIDLLTTHVAPNSWSDVGGPAPLESFHGLLVFAQTERNHREAAALLDALEEHCLRRIGRPAPSEPVWVGLDPANREIAERLSQMVSVGFCGEPLEDALQKLADLADVLLVLDQTGIAEADRSKRLPVTLFAEDIAVSGVLERLLYDTALAYRIGRGELVVAPEEESFARVTRLYPVADVVGPDIVAFEDRLFDEVSPDQWEIVGGPDAADVLASRWLVVSGALATHWQVEDWLHEQRTGSKTQRARQRQEMDEEAVIRGAILDSIVFGDGIEGFWRWLADRNNDDREVAP